MILLYMYLIIGKKKKNAANFFKKIFLKFSNFFLFLIILIFFQTQTCASSFKEITKSIFKKTQDHFNFRCPLDGEIKVGQNWSDTH